MMRSTEKALRTTAGLLSIAMLLGHPVAARSAPRGFDAVPVTAINYTGREMNAVLFINPADPKDVAGGPPILPYGGSGEMCCYALPHKWKAGIQVKVRYDWWIGDVPRDYQFLTVEVPPYPTDEPGTLWALFYEDGTMEVVASAVDPGHPKWPGKVKHWPIPSREYKLKLWQAEFNEYYSMLKYSQQKQQGLPDAERFEVWESRVKRREKSLSEYLGPDDPKFVSRLKKEGAEGIEIYGNLIKRLEDAKP